jgi:phosphoenolpyruvate synthase/pyruvate phosphate dikinase
MAKRVYLFSEGSKDDRDLLGGKGANLCEMTSLGLPVPFGFIITTPTCREFFENGNRLPEAAGAGIPRRPGPGRKTDGRALRRSGESSAVLRAFRCARSPCRA